MGVRTVSLVVIFYSSVHSMMPRSACPLHYYIRCDMQPTKSLYRVPSVISICSSSQNNGVEKKRLEIFQLKIYHYEKCIIDFCNGPFFFRPWKKLSDFFPLDKMYENVPLSLLSSNLFKVGISECMISVLKG